MRFFPLLIVSMFANAFGNILLSRSMKQVRDPIGNAYAVGEYLQIVWTVLSNPSFLGAVGLLIAFFLMFLTMLSKADLSYVMPLTAINYAVTVLLAAVMLGETVTAARWGAVALITLGVFLVSGGKPATGASKPVPAKETNPYV